MSAFVVHDLKNIVTQLCLMMKNAKRLQANPEFQEDMLATVENSLEKMRQLMLQLREGEAPAGGHSGVELAPLVRRIEAVAAERGRTLEVAVADAVVTRGHEERIERVLGHVVQNALDATRPKDRVWLKLEPPQRPGADRGRRHGHRHVAGIRSDPAVQALPDHQEDRHGHRRLRKPPVRARARRQHLGRQRARTRHRDDDRACRLFESRHASDLQMSSAK